jgi:hypothetical protein
MAETTSAPLNVAASLGTVAQVKQATSSEKPQTETQTAEVEYATKAEMSAIQKRLDGISTGLRQVTELTKSTKAPEKPDASTQVTDPIYDKREFEELKAWKKEQEAEAALLLEERAVDRIAKTLKGKVIEGLEERFARLFYTENKDKLKVEKKTYNVSYVHSDTEVSPIETYLDAYLQTPVGQQLLPIKSNPKSDGLLGTGRTSDGNNVRIVKMVGGRVPAGILPEDIIKGKVRLVN